MEIAIESKILSEILAELKLLNKQAAELIFLERIKIDGWPDP